MKRIIFLLAAVLGMVLVPTVASAHAVTTSSIVLNPSPLPALGATVTFTASYPNGTKNPVIESVCYQNGVIVWGEVQSVSDANTYGFLLGGGSSPWLSVGGPADCVAQLQSRFWKAGVEQVVNLASTSFTAAG